MRVDAIVPGGHLDYSLVVRLGGSGSESDAIAVNANVNQLQVCRCVQVGRQNRLLLPALAAPPLSWGSPLVKISDFRDSDPSAASAGKGKCIEGGLQYSKNQNGL